MEEQRDRGEKTPAVNNKLLLQQRKKKKRRTPGEDPQVDRKEEGDRGLITHGRGGGSLPLTEKTRLGCRKGGRTMRRGKKGRRSLRSRGDHLLSRPRTRENQ